MKHTYAALRFKAIPRPNTPIGKKKRAVERHFSLGQVVSNSSSSSLAITGTSKAASATAAAAVTATTAAAAAAAQLYLNIFSRMEYVVAVYFQARL